MKTVPQTVRFSAPLRDLRLVSDQESQYRLEEQLQESYQRGLRDGERRLGEQLVQQRAEMFGLQNGVFASLRQTLPQVIAECQDSLVTLAVQVAEKLVAGMPISKEMVEAAIREAMSHVEQTTDFQVLLNPSDLELLKKFNSPLASKESSSEGIELQSSPDVSPGGCIVQTKFGTVDARRETKLALLQEMVQS